MKRKGIIIKYNQASGIIKDEQNINYIFTKNSLKKDVPLKENDKVLFNPEKFQTVDVTENIATFVEKIKIEDK